MSDVSTSDPLLQDQPDDTPSIRAVREALRAEKAKNADLTTQVGQGAEAIKRNAFIEAGVDITTPVGGLLFENYKGDVTVDAVKAQAEPLGLLRPPEPPTPTGPSDDERRLQSLQGGIAGEGDNTPGAPIDEATDDPWTGALKGFNQDLSEGKDRDTAAAKALGQVFGAAVAGDQRVIHDHERWRESFGQ